MGDSQWRTSRYALAEDFAAASSAAKSDKLRLVLETNEFIAQCGGRANPQAASGNQ